MSHFPNKKSSPTKKKMMHLITLLWISTTTLVSAFVAPQLQQTSRTPIVAVKMAEGGAPQYTKRAGSVIFNREVGRSSYLLRVNSDDGEELEYQPGNVLALEIPDPENPQGEEWMRGPYTVTRVITENNEVGSSSSFDILYRVVGKKTETFRKAAVGDALQFGGKFKVPILEGIEKDGLERVVGISTGVGIGPLIGFAEEALSDQDYPARIDLFVAFRNHDDICCRDVLDDLSTKFANRFSWTPILSSEQGHISTPENLKLVSMNGAKTPGATHYHLIGNGSMVNEWTAGLSEADVPDERVTIEMYFNHKETPRPEAISSIGAALNEAVLSS